jgi:hypothetical protein
MPAPAGTFVDVEGATQATPCPLGHFQPDAGSTSCLPAPIGTYVDALGAVAATDCPPGTTTDAAGSTSSSDCVESLLAVAYSNLDGIDGYDPTAGDVLIAKLVDTNLDGVVSVGDEVVTDRFPLDFDASAFGSFQNTSHAVDAVDQSQAGSIKVLDATGSFYYWEHNVDPSTERYIESDPAGTFKLVLGEQSTQPTDWLRAYSDAPSAPDPELGQLTRSSTTDDPFVDVDLLN